MGTGSWPVGSPGESHLRAPTEPCVAVSRYTALVVLVTRLAGPRLSRPRGRRTSAAASRLSSTGPGLSCDPAAFCTCSGTTQVGHVVRFVEHADLDIAEVAVALLDEVGQAPG